VENIFGPMRFRLIQVSLYIYGVFNDGVTDAFRRLRKVVVSFIWSRTAVGLLNPLHNGYRDSFSGSKEAGA
jgi:hypothetical protein